MQDGGMMIWKKDGVYRLTYVPSYDLPPTDEWIEHVPAGPDGGCASYAPYSKF